MITVCFKDFKFRKALLNLWLCRGGEVRPRGSNTNNSSSNNNNVGEGDNMQVGGIILSSLAAGALVSFIDNIFLVF